MGTIIFLIIIVIVGYFEITLLIGTIGNPNFGTIGGSGAYFSLFLLLAIGFLVVFGSYHLLL